MKTQIACAGTAYRDDNGLAFDRGYKYGDITTTMVQGASQHTLTEDSQSSYAVFSLRGAT
jgi:hypothetical protein